MKYISRFFFAFVLGIGLYDLIDLIEQQILGSNALQTKPRTVVIMSLAVALLSLIWKLPERRKQRVSQH